MEDLERTRRRINTAVWGIAVGVMIYGAINVTSLLIDHGIWVQVAWLLSIMIDLAMCVGLMGDRVLHQYGRRDGWVTALRWSTAVMTLILNTARPALAHDWVGVGIHTAGPVLLLLVAEAAGSFQRQLTAIIQELRIELAELEQGPERISETGPSHRDETGDSSLVSPTTPPSRPSLAPGRSASVETRDQAASRETSLAGETPSLGTTHDPRVSTPTETTAAPTSRPSNDGGLPTTKSGNDGTPARSGDTDMPAVHEKPNDHRESPSGHTALTMRKAMWEHWHACRAAGRRVTGADLDRAFGTNNYGRRVIKEWVIAGRITDADVTAARLAPTATAVAA